MELYLTLRERGEEILVRYIKVLGKGCKYLPQNERYRSSPVMPGVVTAYTH